MVELAHAHGARCAVDASGPALSRALASGADLLAPNRLELAEIDPGAACAHTVSELGRAAADLARTSATSLLVSLGADGALFTDGTLVVHGRGPTLTPRNTAGAGDALLSGWLAETGTPAERMARAVRWSRAACLATTTVAPVPAQPDPSDGVTVDLLPVGRPERSPS
jgi:1-phosphofructokinase